MKLRVLLSFFAGLLLVPLIALCWYGSATFPSAVADNPLPMERLFTTRPLDSRVKKEAPKKAPFDPDEENLTGGAQVYRDECAVCHGFHGKPGRLAKHLSPAPLQIWDKHPGASGPIVGLSEDPVGAIYWKTANGIRLSAMPAYKGILTDSQLWEVSQLLANADKPLPPLVIDILHGAGPAPAPAAGAAPAEPASASDSAKSSPTPPRSKR